MSNPVPAAAASGGVVGSLVIIICYAISFAHVQVPAEISAALMVLLTPVVHVAAVKWGFDPSSLADQAPPHVPPPGQQ